MWSCLPVRWKLARADGRTCCVAADWQGQAATGARLGSRHCRRGESRPQIASEEAYVYRAFSRQNLLAPQRLCGSLVAAPVPFRSSCRRLPSAAAVASACRLPLLRLLLPAPASTASRYDAVQAVRTDAGLL